MTALTATGGLTRIAACGLLAGLACTPTLDFLQCRDSRDCVNADGRDLICSADNECIARPNPSDIECDDLEDCERFFESDHVCGPAGVCANLISVACPLLSVPAETDPEDIVYVGSILPTSPPFDETTVPIQNAVQLAIEDFNTISALPDGRKIGLVGCDSQGNPNIAVEAAQHLTQDVGVPAIIGPAFSEAVLAVAEQVAIPERTFLISPTATNKGLTDLNDDGLVWRTISSDVYQASAIVDRLATMEPPANRILILAKNDAYGSDLLEDVLPLIDVALPTAAPAGLLYTDPAKFSSAEEMRNAYGAIIGQGFAHAADTVVFLGTSEVRDLILFYLQARDGVDPPPPLPTFLVSHGAVPILENVVELVNNAFAPALMMALEGTSPIIQDPENFMAYNIRYRIRFADEEPLSASSLGYDAAMVAALAMVGSVDPTSGVEVARAVPRLVDKGGTPVPFRDGIQFIVTASDSLAAGGGVDLQGVSGALDFDLVTGEVRTDLIGWDVLPKTGTTAEPVLTPRRQYILDPAPAFTGTWMDLPAG